MKKAKITKEGGFQCAPEGHSVVTFAKGEIVEGKIAEWALANHAASAMFPDNLEKKIVAPKETKAKRGKASK